MDISFTEAAAQKVKDLLAEGDMAEEGDQALRVFVQGGGCTGFQYGFAFEGTFAEDDWVIEEHGMKFVVDPLSAVYLEGATVDYHKSIMGEQFTIDNPNATTQCGCGSSFGV